MSRLPIHPPPAAGEALSSWLARLARMYRMSPHVFVAEVVGEALKPDDLDCRPSDAVVQTIELATGIPGSEIRRHTVRGTLGAATDRVISASIGSVLIPSTMHVYSATRWGHLWEYNRLTPRICVICFHTPAASRVIQLAWRLPISIGCPVHGVSLSDTDGLSWRLIRPRPVNVPYPDEASRSARAHDQRLQSAILGEPIALVRGVVSGDQWIGGLHRVVEELTQPGLHLNLPTDARDELGLTAGFRDWVFASSWPRLEAARFPTQARVAAAAARVAAFMEAGLLAAPGCGLIATALRPAALRPRSERMRLTYSEPLPPPKYGPGAKRMSLEELIEVISAPGFLENIYAHQKSRARKVYRT